jgi:hypothetical protein
VVTLLGAKGKRKRRQDKDGLIIDIPESIAENRPCAQARVFKIKAQPFQQRYD